MTETFFQLGMVDEACGLVRQFHYSRRPPASIQTVGTLHTNGGLFGDMGPAVAACFFSIPPTKWSEPLWELTRLVRHDDVQVSLTGLISRTCKAIKAAGGVGLLVSYADSTQGHHGGIYQAASWQYDGKRARACDGVIIDGQFFPGRTCNTMWGTRSPDKLQAKFPDQKVEPHWDDGKHLYWRALNREGKRQAKALGLRIADYPKPDHTNGEGTNGK